MLLVTTELLVVLESALVCGTRTLSGCLLAMVPGAEAGQHLQPVVFTMAKVIDLLGCSFTPEASDCISCGAAVTISFKDLLTDLTPVTGEEAATIR